MAPIETEEGSQFFEINSGNCAECSFLGINFEKMNNAEESIGFDVDWTQNNKSHELASALRSGYAINILEVKNNI